MAFLEGISRGYNACLSRTSHPIVFTGLALKSTAGFAAVASLDLKFGLGLRRKLPSTTLQRLDEFGILIFKHAGAEDFFGWRLKFSHFGLAFCWKSNLFASRRERKKAELYCHFFNASGPENMFALSWNRCWWCVD